MVGTGTVCCFGWRHVPDDVPFVPLLLADVDPEAVASSQFKSRRCLPDV
jgi:hypothetical protein